MIRPAHLWSLDTRANAVAEMNASIRRDSPRLPRGDGRICPPWTLAKVPSFFSTTSGEGSGQEIGPGNRRMRVLQDPTRAKKNLARLSPDSV